MSSPDIDRVVADGDTRFPALFQLCGGYLHQDWRDEYDSPGAAITAFLDEAPPAAVRDAARELRRLLGMQLDDATLGRVLADGLGCAYRPEHDGIPVNRWLEELLRRLDPPV